jgi:hypothetical protein
MNGFESWMVKYIRFWSSIIKNKLKQKLDGQNDIFLLFMKITALFNVLHSRRSFSVVLGEYWLAGEVFMHDRVQVSSLSVMLLVWSRSTKLTTFLDAKWMASAPAWRIVCIVYLGLDEHTFLGDGARRVEDMNRSSWVANPGVRHCTSGAIVASTRSVHVVGFYADHEWSRGCMWQQYARYNLVQPRCCCGCVSCAFAA